MPVPNRHKPFASRERRGINKNCLAKRCTIEEKQLQDELGMTHVRAGDDLVDSLSLQDHVVVIAKDRAVGYFILSCDDPERSPPL